MIIKALFLLFFMEIAFFDTGRTKRLKKNKNYGFRLQAVQAVNLTSVELGAVICF